MADRNDTMIAVALEAGPGLLIQTFGIGHLYQGRIKSGLLIMLSYWGLMMVNGAVLGFSTFGAIIAFVVWLAYMVLSPTDVLKEGR